MSIQLIVRNWALAFFQAAQDTGKLEQVRKDVTLLKDFLRSGEPLLMQLSSPKFSPADRSDILKKALGTHVTDLTLNFLILVSTHKRQKLLPEILDEFFMVNNQSQKILKATLTSAKELDTSQRQKLQKELEKKNGCTFDIEYKIDPKLLAGFVLVYEDKMLDCSTKGALNRLKRILDV
ncbi:MAG: ATP synthase F1 subunit delta [Fibrobacter sp.]|jgi:F-type H+-transporting ATPase subunit delta|nr:ATP synthase F1 subunit delta [Fibrobacter sp.]